MSESIQGDMSLVVEQESSKSRSTYVLLAVLFGMFGIHNFYADRQKQGLPQLCISLAFVIVRILTDTTDLHSHIDPDIVFYPSIVAIMVLVIMVIQDIFTNKCDGKGLKLK